MLKRKSVAENVMRFSMASYLLLPTTSRRNFLHTHSESVKPILNTPIINNPPQLAKSLLLYKEDKYDGVIVNMDSLATDVDQFKVQLSDSLTHWKSQEKRGIWLKIPISKVNLVESAVKQGFVYHHAEKDYLMLTHWLSTKSESKLPQNATHQLGVGCIVLNKNNDILAVQEHSGILRGMGVWKMPTGLAEEGEDISVAAMREVYEETGIRTKFRSILCFRQSHNIMFGKSDMFVICVMDLEDPDKTDIVVQTSELVDCQWVKPEVYFNQEFFKNSGVHAHINKLIKRVMADKLAGNSDTTTSSGDSASASYRVAPGGGSKLPSIVMTRLPNGLRPGLQTIYHIDSAVSDEIKS